MATIKQKLAAKKIVESGGKMPVSRAMLEAGFSPATAKTPQKLTESKGFQHFLSLLPSEERVVKVLDDGLDAWKRDHFSGEIYPDFKERRETAKDINEIRGYRQQSQTLNQFNVGEMSLSFTTKEANAN